MSQPAGGSQDSFACVRCGAAVPVSALACPACGLEVYPPVSEGECRCAACGGDMSVDDLACPHCGAAVTILETGEGEYFCTECGGDVAEDDAVCPHCGADLEEAEGTPDEADGYVCSECGGDVAEDDAVCPHCGADVAEIVEAPPAPDQAEPPAHTLTVRQVTFLNEADRLPEACVALITPLGGEQFVIPAREPKVGNIVIRLLYSEIAVLVGRHTECRFPSAREAVDFVDDVVNGRLAFHFADGEVEMCEAKEVDDAEAMEASYYVWNGPLRNQRTGIDWYRPPGS